MDMTALGTLTAELMQDIEEAFELHDDVSVRTVMVMVEIDKPDSTHFRVVCNDDRPWVQLAFMDIQRDKFVDLLEAQAEAALDHEDYESDDDD